MSQETLLETTEETHAPKPFLQSVGYAGGTFAGMGAIGALAHFGPTGLFFAAAGSLIAYKHGADISDSVKDKYARLDPQTKRAIHAVAQRFGHGISEEDVADAAVESIAQPKLSEEEMARAQEVKKAFEGEIANGEPIFPLYPPAETMRLGKVVATGQRFDPSINNFLGYGAIFAGSQGSGKSVAVAVLAEHLGEREMSEVIFDMKREYFSILSVVSHGIIAGHPDAATTQEFHGLPFHGLTVENAGAFALDVMEKGYQAVVDIPSFLECSGNDWNLVAKIITAVLDGLMRWSIAQKDEERWPCLVAFDEAHIFFPQNAEMKNLFDLKVLNPLSAAAFSMVNMGRSYGYTTLFSTQRIANIAKWTIGNCQIKVIMRHSVDVDLDRCSEEIGKDERGKPYATAQMIKTLPAKQGYGYVIGFTQDPYLIQFDMRRSYHPSNTPTMERVQQRKEKSVQSRQPVQRLPELLEDAGEESVGLSMRELCEAVIEMADMHYKGREIIHLLEISEREYCKIVGYIKTHRSEFGRASAPSSTSLPGNFRSERPDFREVAQEANGSQVSTGSPIEAISNLSTIRALREIGKRLKNGEDKAKIVRSFGLPYGRATQEMSAVVDMVEEQIKAGGE